MSEGYTNPAVDEMTSTSDAEAEIVMESLNSDEVYQVNESAEVSEAKKFSLQDAMTFVDKKILTPKVRDVIAVCFDIVMIILGLLQVLLWGLTIKDTYQNYVDVVLNKDYVGIGLLAVVLVFVIAIIANVVGSITALMKKNKEPRFATAATMFGFYVFSMFVKVFFASKTAIISDFTFNPIIDVITGLVIAYAIVRLIANDFLERIIPFVFTCAAIGAAILMYSEGIGNFGSFAFSPVYSVPVSGFNAYTYLESALKLIIENSAASNAEMLLFGFGNLIDIGFGEAETQMIILIMQFVPIVVANVLPFAAISVMGYLIYGLTSKNYIQYHRLELCRKATVSMIVLAIISAAVMIGTYYICEGSDCVLSVELNVTNMIITAVTLVAMMLFTVLPWKIFVNVHGSKQANQDSEGGRY